MCFGSSSRPPVAPAEGAPVESERIELTAADGNVFASSLAAAPRPSGAAVIVLPDYHGLTPYYEELASRFAEHGVDAIVIDYYGRTAEAPPRETSFDPVTHAGRTTWQGLQADVRAAADELRSRRDITSLFSIGFCFGGRVSFLLATVAQLDMAGVIGFYGWPVGQTRNDTPAPADVAGQMQAPVLGLFGGADAKIPATDVAAFERALEDAAVDHRVRTFEGAPHSFFDRQRDDFAEASSQAWDEVIAFVETHRRG